MSGMKHYSLLLGMLGGLLLCTNVQAQQEDKDATIQELKKGQEQLQEEVSATRAELKTIRELLKKISRDLATVKAGQRPATKQKRQPDTTVYNVKIGDSPFLGPKDAAVTIVEFADFQCPYCVREYPKIQQVLKDYPNDVKFVLKHFPLGFHKKAPAVHAASILAHQQLGNEGFWKMHDLIIKNPKALEVADLRKHAVALELDLAAFDKLMADPKSISALLAEDKAEAVKCKVRGTPTVLVNGLRLSPRNPSDYKARVDQILKGKGKK